jgi:hypothetical protein
MATRADLEHWVLEALEALGGRARIVAICEHVWHHHEQDLRKSGDLFYTWQYDIRWAGQRLRDAGRLKAIQAAQGSARELP